MLTSNLIENFLQPLVERLLSWLPIRPLKPAELRFRVILLKPAEPVKPAQSRFSGQKISIFQVFFVCNSDI